MSGIGLKRPFNADHPFGAFCNRCMNTGGVGGEHGSSECGSLGSSAAYQRTVQNISRDFTDAVALRGSARDGNFFYRKATFPLKLLKSFTE